MIKILDAWWVDPKRSALVRRVKSCELADGVAVDLWREFKELETIPVENFHSNYTSELKGSGLIDSSETLVWVIGRGVIFDWVCTKAQAGRKGGLKASERKRNARGQLVAPGGQLTKHPPKQVQAKTKHKALLGDLSTKTSTEIAVSNNPVSDFIGVYVTAFQKRYGREARPDLRGKIVGQIKNLLRDVPYDRACNLMEVYLQLDTAWFITKGHDFTTFIENLNPIGIALDTGNKSSNVNWNKVFKPEMDF